PFISQTIWLFFASQRPWPPVCVVSSLGVRLSLTSMVYVPVLPSMVATNASFLASGDHIRLLAAVVPRGMRLTRSCRRSKSMASGGAAFLTGALAVFGSSLAGVFGSSLAGDFSGG